MQFKYSKVWFFLFWLKVRGLYRRLPQYRIMTSYGRSRVQVKINAVYRDMCSEMGNKILKDNTLIWDLRLHSARGWNKTREKVRYKREEDSAEYFPKRGPS